MREGRCLCGAVRFTADGPPKWTGYCHCQSCRRHTGAPVSAYAGFEAAKVRFTGDSPISNRRRACDAASADVAARP